MHHNKKFSPVVPIGTTGKFKSKMEKFPKIGPPHRIFLCTHKDTDLGLTPIF
jgi:hypothetical protein